MARSSVRAIVTAAALWNLLSVGDSIAGEEVIKNFSLSLQNGFYVGADYLQESKLGDVSPQDVPSWASGRIGWQGSVGKFSSVIGLA